MSAARSSERVLVTRAARIMATDVSVQLAVALEDEADARRAAGACMDWLAEVDARLSRFRPDSELSHLNAAADRWLAASELLFSAVACAMRAAEASGGLFDPTLLPLLEAHGYDRDFSHIAHRETNPATLERSAAHEPAPDAWRDIELDVARRRIRLPRGVRLDLGGIAKGWAADVAMERFCEPFANVLVNVGGDLRLRGGPGDGACWSIGIRDPRREPVDGDPALADSCLAVVAMSRGGLATSGAVRRWWLRDGQRRHHLLDPRTGQPIPLWLDERDDAAHTDGGAPLLATATALAPTAARAEVAAKLALLRGYPAALRAVENAWERHGAVGPDADCDAGVALTLVSGSGEVMLSANIQDYLATWGTDGASLPMYVRG